MSYHQEEMWQGRANIRRNERTNFNLTYFVNFSVILRNRCRTPEMFYSGFGKETLTMIQTLIRKSF